MYLIVYCGYFAWNWGMMTSFRRPASRMSVVPCTMTSLAMAVDGTTATRARERTSRSLRMARDLRHYLGSCHVDVSIAARAISNGGLWWPQMTELIRIGAVATALGVSVDTL